MSSDIEMCTVGKYLRLFRVDVFCCFNNDVMQHPP